MSKIVLEDKELGIKITDLAGNSGINKNYSISFGFSQFYFHYYPTNNCQLGSFGSFEDLLNTSKTKTVLKFLLDNGVKKPLMLIDIRNKSELVAKVKDTFSEILSETPYTSTNESSMILFMVRMDSLK